MEKSSEASTWRQLRLCATATLRIVRNMRKRNIHEGLNEPYTYASCSTLGHPGDDIFCPRLEKTPYCPWTRGNGEIFLGKGWKRLFPGNFGVQLRKNTHPVGEYFMLPFRCPFLCLGFCYIPGILCEVSFFAFLFYCCSFFSCMCDFFVVFYV